MGRFIICHLSLILAVVCAIFSILGLLWPEGRFGEDGSWWTALISVGIAALFGLAVVQGWKIRREVNRR